MTKKILVAIGVVLLALLVLFIYRVNVLAQEEIKPAPQEICIDCPVVKFEAIRLVCPDGWRLDGDWCKKGDRDSVRQKKEAFNAEVTYVKSEDPNKCHKPTPESVGVPSWATKDFARLSEFLDGKVIECPKPPSTIRWCFPNDSREHPYVAKAIPSDEKPEVGFPWETGMDEWCEKPQPPQQCEVEAWSCSACQYNPNEHADRLGVCYEDFVGYCGEAYGCSFQKVCSDSITKDEECKEVWVCKDTCEVPDPDPEPEPEPEPEATTTSTSTPSAPQCTDGTPASVPANPHVVRNGSEATVNAHIPEGNQVNIYYKENDADGWQHSASDIPVVDNYVSYTIKDLDPNVGYTFGIQSANGCAGGETVLAVIVDPPAYGKVFTLSFWEWAF